ncbi:MAG: NTP transferase domain-containing protein [Bacteroidetes bacterium]|nr:NTP transferase domain-containing protein [Bacteroidota bacterium]
MKAIIPVAGMGSRLRPHTYTLPKVMLSVAGKPIIGHIFDKLIDDGITEATVIIGYMGDVIENYLRKNYKIPIDFVEQPELLGLGHSIWVAQRTFSDTEPIFIILGDTIFDVDLKKVFSEKMSSLGVKYVEDPRRFGVAEVENGLIRKLIEKPEHPTSHLAMVGLYYITNPSHLKESLNYLIDNNIRTKNEYQLTDALQRMIEKGEKFTTFNVEGWYDCGKPETLLHTNQVLLAMKAQQVSMPGVVINSPVFIHPSAKISNSVVGPNASIGENAIIKNSIVRNSIIGSEAKVDASMLEESIVGNGAHIAGRFRRVNVGDMTELDFK